MDNISQEELEANRKIRKSLALDVQLKLTKETHADS